MTTCKKNRQVHLSECIANRMSLMPSILVGKCCECIKYHRNNYHIPPCYFTEEQLREDKDTSIDRFVMLNHKCSCHKGDN